MKVTKGNLVNAKNFLLQLGNVADTVFSKGVLAMVKGIDKVMEENDVELPEDISKYLQEKNKLRDVNEKHTFMKKNASLEEQFKKMVESDRVREIELSEEMAKVLCGNLTVLPGNLTAMQLDIINKINDIL